MKRRGFILALGIAMASCPLVAQAQQVRVPTIGVLVLGSPPPAPFLAAFREGLRIAGYVEGKSIRLELRSADGKAAQLPALAAELVALNVDVIVVWHAPAAQAAKQATRVIPIVMAQVGGVVATGLVESLARPGGNITGTSGIASDIIGKNLEILRELQPSVRRVAVLANEIDPFTVPFMAQIELAAQTLDLKIQKIGAKPDDDFEPHFDAIRRSGVDAVLIQPSLINDKVAALSRKLHIPSTAPDRIWPATMGGLFSFAAVHSVLWREAATYVDKILRGARPGDLPVSQPTTYELVINLQNAKALGIAVPPTLLARADEVIE